MVTFANRAKVSTSTTGTGTITLGTAVDGYQTFTDAGVVNSDVVRYTIEDGDAWEIGSGTYSAGTLTRVLDESSTGSLLSLSGDAVVYVTAAGQDIVQPSDLATSVVGTRNLAAIATLPNITTGTDNFVAGNNAGANLTTGSNNVAIGNGAMDASTIGSVNVAIGRNTMGLGAATDDAGYNVAIGDSAGYNITSATDSVLIGFQAGYTVQGQSNNIGIGWRAARNSRGIRNIGIGQGSLQGDYTSLLTGRDNIGLGYYTGANLTTGGSNFLVGYGSGLNLTTGSNNVAIGESAGNTLTTGGNNIVLGHGADASSATVSNEITLGNTSIDRFRIPGLQSGASDGDVMTYDATSGTIGLSAPAGGGTTTAVASGSLTNGDPVIINSDGTVSVAGTTTVSESAGSPTILSNWTDGYVSAVYDANAQKVVVVYQDRDNSSYGTAAVGTVSGTSISFGTPVVFESANTIYIAATYDSDTQQVVIAYRDIGNSSYGTAIVGAVSGTSISFGSPSVFLTSTLGGIGITYDSANQKIVAIYNDQDNSNHGISVVGTVSGTSISFGTPVTFTTNNTGFNIRGNSAAYDPNSGKIVAIYRDGSNSSYPTAVVGTVSGTSISFGTPVVIESVGTQVRYDLAYHEANQTLLACYVLSGSPFNLKAAIGTVSGTSISFGTPTSVTSGETRANSVSYDSAAEKMVFVYNDGSIYAQSASVSGNTITLDTRLQIDGSSFSQASSSTYDANAQKVIAVYDDASDDVAVVAYQAAYSSSNITATNFIGFSDGAYSSTATATITVDGGVNSGQSSLTTGSPYYLADDGTLSTTNNGRKAGVATSATSLLVSKALTGPEMNDYLGSLL